MHRYSITALRQHLAAKDFSAQELTAHYLKRIADNQHLNCFINVDPEKALAQAKIADQKLKQDNPPPLTGIPIAHKDNFCTSTHGTTCGSKMLAEFVSPYNATIVERLATAGTITLGKTNMDEFAMGSSNETSYFGAVYNPWHRDYVPGGSSGGSAAAVAACLTTAATGSDTGGSIRQPAAFCGVTGIKPTYGLVSRYGMIALASSLDQGGLFTRTAADAALLLQAIAGHDPMDATSVNHPLPNYSTALTQLNTGLTVGLPQEYFDASLPAELTQCLEQAIATLRQLGVGFKSIHLKHSQSAVPTYYVLAPAEISANLARYDGIRFGYQATKPKTLAELYQQTRSEGFGEEVKRRILLGTYLLSADAYEHYYLPAQKIRQLITDDFKQAFEHVDLILTPTTPNTAFKLGEKLNDPLSMYGSDRYTMAVNLAGLPALSLPCGFVNKLPVGLQLIGNYFQEAQLLNLAHHYQLHSDWHLQQPPE
jgi:aspartyl-tRNA(Asn)/glutamyl-tRNA(Gln) amidotransferase subunit A